MGSIRKRGRVWYVDYRANGRRVKKRIGASKHVAELALKDIEVRMAKGDLGFLPKDSDLEKLFQQFQKYSITNHSPATVKRYRAIIDNFKAYLGTSPHIKKISQLDTKFFDDYKSYRKDNGANPKTINMELATLKMIFSQAIKWGLANENPVNGIEPMKIIRKTEPRFLTDKECELLLANCGEWLFPIFFTFLHTGMRKQELMTLEWSDVDFNRKVIKIRVKDDWTPKTAEREIPINQALYRLLTQHKELQGGTGLVFPDLDGEKIENNKLRKELMKVAKKCGFPDVTKIHSLRHTFASHLVMNGVDLPTVKQLMGHSDIATTMIYAHLAPDHLVTAIDKLKF